MLKAVNDSKDGATFGFSFKEADTLTFRLLKTNIKELAVSRLQPALDAYLSNHVQTKIDYIHGEEELLRLSKVGAVSIFLPPIEKDGFFSTIVSRGTLPRKSFSMGEADEKRFYLECRSLR
jgi:uncharacterized protein (DUF1015 family)